MFFLSATVSVESQLSSYFAVFYFSLASIFVSITYCGVCGLKDNRTKITLQLTLTSIYMHTILYSFIYLFMYFKDCRM